MITRTVKSMIERRDEIMQTNLKGRANEKCFSERERCHSSELNDSNAFLSGNANRVFISVK